MGDWGKYRFHEQEYESKIWFLNDPSHSFKRRGYEAGGETHAAQDAMHIRSTFFLRPT